MKAYNPLSLSTLWFNRWRRAIRDAKDNDANQDFYCAQAVLFQAEFVMYQAEDK